MQGLLVAGSPQSSGKYGQGPSLARSRTAATALAANAWGGCTSGTATMPITTDTARPTAMTVWGAAFGARRNRIGRSTARYDTTATTTIAATMAPRELTHLAPQRAARSVANTMIGQCQM